MKTIASSIILLAAVFMLTSAAHFDSLLFWVIGIVMLIDGAVLLITSTVFPSLLDKFATE